MANVLTDLAADIYRAADIVGRELVGAIPSVTLNTDATRRVALNDTIRSHFTRQGSTENYTPAMAIPEGTDQTVDNKTMTLDNARSYKIPWTGEDMKHVNNGSGFETIYGDQIEQAIRTHVNDIESDLLGNIYLNSSRAHGTAGTTPFISNFDEVAEIRQILVDNGAPITDGRSTIVMNTSAGTNLRQLAQLQKVNESGNERMLRRGELLNLQGLMMKESAQVASHTAGSADEATTDASGYSIGDTSITLASAGSGQIKAGDVVTFSGDSNKYVVKTGDAASSDGGTIVLHEPGLRQAIAASATAITVISTYTANVAFHQAAVELGVRAPAMPQGGDDAVDIMDFQDPVSGLVFQIAAYKGYGKAMFDVRTVYGYKVWKPEFVATLLG